MIIIRLITVFLISLIVQSETAACDACGCSILGQPSGLLSSYRKSYLSLGWSQSGFSSAPGIGEGSVDAFNTIDLTFDYYFSDRLRAGVYMPFRINTRTVNQENNTVQGIGDIRMDMNYTFFKQDKSTSPVEIYLEAGAGINLPSGKYDPYLHDQNLPENFNLGNGSMGLSLQQTSGFSYRSFGMVIKNTWSSYTKTKTDYSYGNQWSASILMLADIPMDSSFSIVPLASVQFEKIWSDTYANGLDVQGTGGNGVFVSTGCQLKIKNWLCTFQYALPVSDHYGAGEVLAGNRINVQMTHLF